MSDAPVDLRAVGERIAHLLDRLQATASESVWFDVSEAVRLLTELYGAALAEVLALAPDDLRGRLAEHELIGSLLLVHDLHPDNLGDRAAAAIAELGSEVSLVSVDGKTVRVSVLAASEETVVRALAATLPDATVDVEVVAPVRLGRKPAPVDA